MQKTKGFVITNVVSDSNIVGVLKVKKIHVVAHDKGKGKLKIANVEVASNDEESGGFLQPSLIMCKVMVLEGSNP